MTNQQDNSTSIPKSALSASHQSAKPRSVSSCSMIDCFMLCHTKSESSVGSGTLARQQGEQEQHRAQHSTPGACGASLNRQHSAASLITHTVHSYQRKGNKAAPGHFKVLNLKNENQNDAQRATAQRKCTDGTKGDFHTL